jgi:anti-sigma regulatory factor (Ser/Thr protein kinase)
MDSMISTVFPAVAPSAASARRFVASALTRQRVARDQVALAVLLVSELVTNSYRHAGTETRVSVSVDDVIRVEVFDSGEGGVELLASDVDRISGRGLQIVDALADRWGHEDGPEGAHVWFELDRGPRRGAGVA